jgi:hypothetical protein
MEGATAAQNYRQAKRMKTAWPPKCCLVGLQILWTLPTLMAHPSSSCEKHQCVAVSKYHL